MDGGGEVGWVVFFLARLADGVLTVLTQTFDRAHVDSNIGLSRRRRRLTQLYISVSVIPHVLSFACHYIPVQQVAFVLHVL